VQQAGIACQGDAGLGPLDASASDASDAPID
jgi:hypothetical protein